MSNRSRVFPLLVFLASVGCSQNDQELNDLVPDKSLPSVSVQSEPSDTKSAPTFTHEIVGNTTYYLDGPQQGRNPDGTFAIGTRVKLIRDAGSYAQVESESGVIAFVSVSSLKMLP